MTWVDGQVSDGTSVQPIRGRGDFDKALGNYVIMLYTQTKCLQPSDVKRLRREVGQ